MNHNGDHIDSFRAHPNLLILPDLVGKNLGFATHMNDSRKNRFVIIQRKELKCIFSFYSKQNTALGLQRSWNFAANKATSQAFNVHSL